MSAKDAVLRLLETLPDDASIEDIQYHLYVLQKIRIGEEAAAGGKVLAHEEVMRELAASPLRRRRLTRIDPRRGDSASRPMSLALDALTRSPLKRWLFAIDPFVHECWRDFTTVWANEALDVIAQTTFIVVTPDAIAGRRVELLAGALVELGFVPTALATFRFNRWSLRELYRYALDGAGPYRLRAMDLLFTVADSLILLLRDPHPEPTAADRLCLLKGSWLTERRRPHHLRSRIGAKNGLLSFLHAPDEPADVLRELGIVCDQECRRSLLASVRSQSLTSREIMVTVDRLYAESLEHDRELVPAIGRITAACARYDRPAATAPVRHACEQALAGLSVDWEPARAAAQSLGLDIAEWDWVVFAAETSIRDEVPRPPLFQT